MRRNPALQASGAAHLAPNLGGPLFTCLPQFGEEGLKGSMGGGGGFGGFGGGGRGRGGFQPRDPNDLFAEVGGVGRGSCCMQGTVLQAEFECRRGCRQSSSKQAPLPHAWL